MTEHPDVAAALRTGYPAGRCGENRDCPESRAEYLEEFAGELTAWLQLGYPEILDEFIALSGRLCSVGYWAWLN